MSLFHSRCRSIETLLVARVKDLEEQLDRLHELNSQLAEEAHARETALWDRLIAVESPSRVGALNSVVARSGQPAGPRPVVSRGGGQASARTHLSRTMPGQRQRPPMGRGPIASPEDMISARAAASHPRVAAAVSGIDPGPADIGDVDLSADDE